MRERGRGRGERDQRNTIALFPPSHIFTHTHTHTHTAHTLISKLALVLTATLLLAIK